MQIKARSLFSKEKQGLQLWDGTRINSQVRVKSVINYISQE
jgi:hypothetical protein